MSSNDKLSDAPGADSPDRYDVIVVGAGFAGMYMLYKCRQLGLSAVVYEAGDDVGGTWFWNRYPGARCDVESLSYSYSFSPELEQEWEWTERYAAQPEILRYAQHTADRFDLRRDIRFETRVLAAHFDDGNRTWTVRTDKGDVATARFCVMATGCLSTFKPPEIDGIDTFRGKIYHTAAWPREEVDFAGQRVGVIGTGSSGVQCIPIIAQQAAHLTVFQRTPTYSLPAQNRPLIPGEQEAKKANYPEWRKAQRASSFGTPWPAATESALEVDDEERNMIYENAWQFGSITALNNVFNDIHQNMAANETAATFVRHKIRSIVRDPDTAEALCPDYPIATKRPTLDTGYYATYNRNNVRLVNLHKSPLIEITESGIRTVDHEHNLDAIVFATGFDAITGALAKIDIRGRDGRALKDTWADGPRTYLGLCSAGFPNLFMITGPGSPSVLSSMIVSIEQHVDLIGSIIDLLDQQGKCTIEPTLKAQDHWVDHVNDVASMSLFSQANSWYLGANVPGKPRVFMPYVGGVGNYRKICDDMLANDCDGFTLT
ncbi:NAD(P)/FAD-dependent oxidoreductase [Rhodococcus olei]|uniref:NAD(P)/FAD-dependent oxidoreductase n=1 Tax=Rhodococcus olei TaxID=2161675 RepID=A0ABP8PS30_9NOCA